MYIQTTMNTCIPDRPVLKRQVGVYHVHDAIKQLIDGDDLELVMIADQQGKWSIVRESANVKSPRCMMLKHTVKDATGDTNSYIEPILI